jgi:hypothetical protein
MSTQIICDGCGSVLVADRRQVVVEGHRANGLRGGHLPDGDFHWCEQCAVFVFGQLAKRREQG